MQQKQWLQNRAFMSKCLGTADLTMKATKASPPAAASAALSDVLYLVYVYIPDVGDLAVLSACSNAYRDAVRIIVAQNAPKFLTSLVRAVMKEPADTAPHFRLLNSVEWLLSTVKAVDSDTMGTLLSIPLVPKRVKRAIFDAGGRFTYEQLVEAAKHRVFCVQDWLSVLPARCRTNVLQETYDVFQRGSITPKILNPSNVTDYLHLMVNCSPSDRAAIQILTHLLEPPKTRSGLSESHRLLQQQITPAVLQHLLLTAVDRRHYKVIQKLGQFPAVYHISTESVRDCYILAIGTKASISPALYVHSGRYDVLKELSVPAIAQHLDGSSAAAVLATAVRKVNSSAVRRLVSLPAVQDVGTAELAAMMLVIVCGDGTSVPCLDVLISLASLPAAQQLSSASIYNIITSTVLRHKSHTWSVQGYLESILQLAPALLLPTAAVAALLDTSISVRSHTATALLLELPAAQQLSAQAVAEYVQTVLSVCGLDITTADIQMVRRLLDHPAATQIAAVAAEDLITSVVDLRTDSSDLLSCLCAKLQNIGTDVFVGLVTTAFGKEDESALRLLQTAVVAQQISVEQLLSLLEAAIKRAAMDDDERTLQLLRSLPVAQSVTADQLHELLDLAILETYPAAVSELLNFSAAALLPASVLGKLLKSALQRNLHDVVEELLKPLWPQVHLLELELLYELVELGMELRLGMSSLRNLLLLLLDRIFGTGTGATVGSSSSNMLGFNQSTLVVPCQLVQGREGSTKFMQQQQQGTFTEEQRVELAKVLTTVLDLAVKHECLTAATFLLSITQAPALIDSTRVQHLLYHAIQQQADQAVEALCLLPAAQAVRSVVAQELLMDVVQRGYVDMTEHICTMGGVREIGPQATLKLLMKGQRSEQPRLVEMLLQCLPAVQQLDSVNVFELIESDMQHIAGQMVCAFVQLPGAAGLTGHQMYKLLRAAVTRKLYVVLASLLLDVPAIQKVGVTDAELLMQICIFSRVLSASQRSVCQQFLDNTRGPENDIRTVEQAVDALFQLLGVQQLGATAVHGLLSAAISQVDSMVVEQLVLLPAAKELARGTVQDLVQLATTAGPNQKIVDSLSSLLAAVTS